MSEVGIKTDKRMRTLIVDDEPIARKILREELELLPDIEIVGEADNGRSAVEQIDRYRPDLVFLDLQMPEMGGFEVIRNLRQGAIPAIVIVTAYDQHAIEAFDAGAVDYLLKPVNEGRLLKSIERARGLHLRPRLLAERAEQLANLSGHGRKIAARNGEEYILLDASEVLAFQAEGELVWIMTAKSRYLATQSLRAVEARMQDRTFQRVHRNAIVNVDHVRKMSALSSQRWLLTMSNGLELIVSKRQAHRVREILRW
jgi:two-component system, LytTR family, response regulator